MTCFASPICTTRRFLLTAGLVGSAVFVGASAEAGSIFVENHSFEAPTLSAPQSPQDFLSFVYFDEPLPGWEKFGPVKTDPNFGVTGKIDTGVFIDFTNTVPNKDGNQAAFLVVDNTSSGANTVAFLQTTGAVFEEGKSYDLTVGVGTSINTPLSGLGGAQDAEKLELVIGYGATNGSDITPVGSFLIDPSDFAPPIDPQSAFYIDIDNLQVPLFDFTAITQVLGTGDAAIGNEIQILIRQVGQGGGAFNIDNVRLNDSSINAIPEPASLLVGAVGMVGLLSRRRRQ